MISTLCRYGSIYCSLLLGLLTPAQVAASPSCDAKPTTIIHVNGVKTTPVGAWTNRDQLAQRFTLERAEAGGLRFFSFAYNQSGGFWADFVQSAKQKGLEKSSRIMRWLAGLNELSPGDNNTISDAFREVAAGLDKLNYVVAPDLQEHVNRYQNMLATGNVILVPHSQGNFYANAAWRTLLTNGNLWQSFGVVGAAVPAGVIASQENDVWALQPYVTHRDDVVIGEIPGSLPPNVGNPNEALLADVLGHGFQEVYLGLADTRSALFDRLELMIRKVEECGITVTSGGNSIKQYTVGMKTSSLDLVQAICETPLGSSFVYTCPYPLALARSAYENTLYLERVIANSGATTALTVNLSPGYLFSGESNRVNAPTPGSSSFGAQFFDLPSNRILSYQLGLTRG